MKVACLGSLPFEVFDIILEHLTLRDRVTLYSVLPDLKLSSYARGKSHVRGWYRMCADFGCPKKPKHTSWFDAFIDFVTSLKGSLFDGYRLNTPVDVSEEANRVLFVEDAFQTNWHESRYYALSVQSLDGTSTTEEPRVGDVLCSIRQLAFTRDGNHIYMLGLLQPWMPIDPTIHIVVYNCDSIGYDEAYVADYYAGYYSALADADHYVLVNRDLPEIYIHDICTNTLLQTYTPAEVQDVFTSRPNIVIIDKKGTMIRVICLNGIQLATVWIDVEANLMQQNVITFECAISNDLHLKYQKTFVCGNDVIRLTFSQMEVYSMEDGKLKQTMLCKNVIDWFDDVFLCMNEGRLLVNYPENGWWTRHDLIDPYDRAERLQLITDIRIVNKRMFLAYGYNHIELFLRVGNEKMPQRFGNIKQVEDLCRT